MKDCVRSNSGPGRGFALALIGALAVLVLTFGFLACGGGGGGGGGEEGGTSEVVGLTYSAGASKGELLSYIINTTTLQFKSTVLESNFGLAGVTVSGTLVNNGNGSYSPALVPNVVIVPIADKFVVGGVDLGVGSPLLFTGVPSRSISYNVTEIAGVYNYVSFQCISSSCAEGYFSYHGTFRVNAGNTFDVCDGGDIDNQGLYPCTELFSGTWTDNGNGLITAKVASDTIATLMLLPSSGSGKVMVGDMKSILGNDMINPGIIVGVMKLDTTSVNISGTYRFYENNGSYGVVTVNDSTNQYTGTYYDSEAGFSASLLGGSLARNFPWEGWLWSTDGNLVLILPESGVYVSSSGTEDEIENSWIEIGAKVN